MGSPERIEDAPITSAGAVTGALKKRRFDKLRGNIWFLRNYGLRAYIRYERARRSGATIDYGRVFTAHERAVLEELGIAPWTKEWQERNGRRGS